MLSDGKGEAFSAGGGVRCLPKQRILKQQWVSRAALGLPWQQVIVVGRWGWSSIPGVVREGLEGKEERETPRSLLTEGSVPLVCQNPHSWHGPQRHPAEPGQRVCWCVEWWLLSRGVGEPNSAAEICFLDPSEEWPWVLDCSSRLPMWGTLSHQS